jgi:O-antigen/teichoic acid export membrane protein
MSDSAIMPSSLIEPTDQVGLVSQAARSLKWSLLYNIVPRLVTPFSTMILAALLTPSDFGLVAIATFVTALARIVVDLGLGKTVIQRQTQVSEAASISLWTSLLISAGLYLALWIASPWIARAYHNSQVVGVIRVASLALPLTALSTAPKALLQRNMEFRSLFWVNSSLLIVQAVASVILAATGIGYWALVLGPLVGLATSAGLVWKLSRWRPKIMVDWPVFRSMLGFSVWVMISGFQNWLFLYADNVIAGLFLGVEGLGTYSLGFNIATLVPGFLAASLGDVAYPSFCKLQDDRRQIGSNLVRVQILLGAILFPVALGLLAIAPSAVELLYGQKWQGLGTVIGILVIMPGLSSIWALNEKAYQAVGRPDVWTKLAGFALLALLPLLWLAAPHGLLTFTLVRFGGAWLLPLANVLFGTRVLQTGIKEQLEGFVSPLCFAAVMFAVVYMLTRLSSPFEGISGWIKLFLIVGVGAVVYIALTWLGNRQLWNRLFLSLRQMRS